MRGLALRLSQVYSGQTDQTPRRFEGQKTERILRKIIHNGLDPIVNGSKGKTNLDRFENDPEGLAQKVSEMVHQVEMDLQDCKTGLNIVEDNEEEEEEERGRSTSRDESPYKKVGYLNTIPVWKDVNRCMFILLCFVLPLPALFRNRRKHVLSL